MATNQSGVARGFYTDDDVHALQEHMQAELGRAGAPIEEFLHWPPRPEGTVEAYRLDCGCRKPRPFFTRYCNCECNQ